MTTPFAAEISLDADVIRLHNREKPRDGHPRFVPFEETEFTLHVRQVMRDWQARYYAHQILPQGKKERAAVAARAHKLLLRRDFLKGSFEFGGRYSGWWMELGAERRAAITIDGEACVELDFQCVSPRIAYAAEGQPVDPEVDLYRLPGALSPRFPREAVKMAFVTLLFRPGKYALKAPPGLSLPKGETFDNLTQIIRSQHPDLKPWLRKARIAEIQRVESDIATLVMEIFCNDLRRPVLPVHDSFIVAQRDEERLGLAMGYAFHKVILGWAGVHVLPAIRGFRSDETAERVKALLSRHVYVRG